MNQLVKGGDYGWPYVYGEGKPNIADEPPAGMTYEEYASKTIYPALLYKAHAAPLDMAFYRGKQFPQSYQNSAFATMHGSWNREEPSGYKVVIARFEDGKPVGFEDFITGFLIDSNKAQFGRVCGIAGTMRVLF